MIAGARLRAGKTNSGKGAARMIAQAVAAARAAGVTGQILVRGDSAYGNSTVGGRLPSRRRAVLAGADQVPHRGRGDRGDS